MPRLLTLVACLLFPGLRSLEAQPVHGQPERSVLEQHQVADVRVFGRYAVVKLPIQQGVTIWNPVQVVRGPGDLMYVANHTGEVYTLQDTDGDGLEDSAHLFLDVRKDGLRSPASLVFRGNDLFVGTAQEVRVYADRDNDRQADTSYTFFGDLPHSEHPYEWTSALTFGPDDHLYAVLTTDSFNAGAAADPKGWRGALLRISPDGKEAERFATGLRSVSGMAFDAGGDLFFIDNAGGGNRNEELNLAQRGQFYGHNPDKYGNPTATEPFLELRTDVAPSGIVFNAPSNDFDGTAGDLFITYYGPGERWTRGSLGRVRFEKNADGTYHAVETPVLSNLPKLSDLEFGPGGDLYVTQVGKTDYWYQPLEGADGAIYRIVYAPWVEPDPVQSLEEATLAVSEEQTLRGRQIFNDLACSACHAVDGKTELLGPNLKDIGRVFSRDELLEEIRDPSLRIKPSMAPTQIVKQNGEVLLGRVISASPEGIRLMVVGNRIIDVLHSDIQSQEPVMKSLMWEGLLDGLSDEDVKALLDYLQGLHLANE